jgi:aerotaxis receptor
MLKMSRELFLYKDTMIVSETDTKGNITYVNDEFCKFAEYTKDELIGKPHNIVRHPDMPKAAFEDLWSHLKSGKTWKGFVKNKSKNGNFYWVHATVFSSVGADGNTRYVSVRVMPNRNDVEEHERVYKEMRLKEY